MKAIGMSELLDIVRKRLRGGRSVDSLGTIVIRFSNFGFLFVVALIISRTFDASGYGAYAFVMAWLNLMIVPALFGTQNLVIRNYSDYEAKGESGKSHGILSSSFLFVLIWSSLLALILFAASKWVVSNKETILLRSFQIGIFALPLLALTTYSEATLRSFNKTILGQLIRRIARPTAMLVLIGLFFLLYKSEKLPVHVVWLLTGSLLITAVLALTANRVYMPRHIRKAKKEYEFKSWFHEAIPLFSINFFTILTRRLETILIGLLTTAEATGLFNAAFKLADLLTLPFQSIVFVIAPDIARLHSEGKKKKLQQLVTKAAAVSFAFSSIAFIVLVAFRHQFLLLFNEKFVMASQALVILAVGDMLRTVIGPGGLVLTMTKNARLALFSAVAGGAVQIPANLILIPKIGIEGAAIANASSIFIRNALNSYLCYRNLGVFTSPLAYFFIIRKTGETS